MRLLDEGEERKRDCQHEECENQREPADRIDHLDNHSDKEPRAFESTQIRNRLQPYEEQSPALYINKAI